MQVNIATLLIIAVVTMFFGYFFGLYEGRGQGYKKRKAEEPGDSPAEGEPQAEEAVAAPPVPATLRVDDPGLLRLKEADGQLLLELDGTRVVRDMLSFDQRKRLIELLTRLRPWVETRPAAPVSAVAQQPLTPPTPPQTAPLPPLPSVQPPVVPAAAPTPTTPAREAPAAPLTMVGQIDAILQERIQNTPLASRGIKLEEAPGGGVNVVVGLQKYAGVGEVQDPEVQAALRAAIAEWERKFTPGL